MENNFTGNVHVALNWPVRLNGLNAQLAYKFKDYTPAITAAWGWAFYALENVNQVAQTIATQSELHYRMTFQPLVAKGAIGILAALLSALWDLRDKFITAARLQFQSELSLASLWSCAGTLSLAYMVVRFLFRFATSEPANGVYHSIIDPLLKVSPRAAIPSVYTFRRVLKVLKHILSPSFLLNTLALPVYLIHQIGYRNLPARRPDESLYFRYASIAVLTPLWVLALAAAMVLFMFSAIVDFFGRSLKRMFGRKPKASGAWYQLDVERGGEWRPDSATSSSIEDMTKLPGAWGSAKVWDDLRRDQGALLRERDSLDAEKAAWKLECTRTGEEKRVLEQEKQRLQDEKAAFARQQQKWKDERVVAEKAKREVEAILKGFIEKSRKNGAVIAEMKRGIEMTQVMYGNPTPPASPKIERSSTTVPPNRRRTRAPAPVTA